MTHFSATIHTRRCCTTFISIQCQVPHHWCKYTLHTLRRCVDPLHFLIPFKTHPFFTLWQKKALDPNFPSSSSSLESFCKIFRRLSMLLFFFSKNLYCDYYLTFLNNIFLFVLRYIIMATECDCVSEKKRKTKGSFAYPSGASFT